MKKNTELTLEYSAQQSIHAFKVYLTITCGMLAIEKKMFYALSYDQRKEDTIYQSEKLTNTK